MYGFLKIILDDCKSILYLNVNIPSGYWSVLSVLSLIFCDKEMDMARFFSYDEFSQDILTFFFKALKQL